MIHKVKYAVFMVTAVMPILFMASCRSQSHSPATSATTMSSLIQSTQSARPATIVDQNGRTVALPSSINRVAMTPLPLPSMYYALKGSTDKIVGIHPDSKSHINKSMLGVLAPDLMNASSSFVKGSDINIEELLKIRPDIIFIWGLYPRQVKQLEAVNIPAIAVYTLKTGDALDSIHYWINLFGTIFGDEKKSSELIAHNHQTADMIQSRIKNLSKDKKPTALIVYRHSVKEISVAGKGLYVQYWLNATGAVNAAENVKGAASVDMEQIYKWDPDIIYLSNFCNTYPEDILNNSIERQDWSKLKAVKNKRVYKIPSGIYRWCPPSADAALMLKWMAQTHHPSLFGDIKMDDEIRRHYAKYYDYSISPEQIEKIIHPVRSGFKSGW